jgi:hypothetical protein
LAKATCLFLKWKTVLEEGKKIYLLTCRRPVEHRDYSGGKGLANVQSNDRKEALKLSPAKMNWQHCSVLIGGQNKWPIAERGSLF